MDKDDFGKLYDEMNQEFMNILEFWSNQAVDIQNGGFVGRIGPTGEICFDAPKGIVLNARILWTFSAAYRMIGSEKLEKLAQRAFNYITEFFWDKENGGLFWETDYLGNPKSRRKQAYAHGFGVYAFSEFYLATGKEEALDYALRLFELIEQNFRDPGYGGYIEALSENWGYLEDVRLSEKEENFPKSMNTHLHILEPYTNLYRAWPDPVLKSRIIDLIQIFQQHIVDPKSGHFTLLFEMDWTRRCDIISFGHEIEGAWLLHEAAKEISEPELINKIKNLALQLVDNVLKSGTHTDGSIYYERLNDHLDTDRHWWPQAEALVGLMDAWEISGDQNYLDAMEKVWKFIRENMIDYDYGEWFGKVAIDGFPNEAEDKAGFWKCPYHNSRAMMEMMRRLKNNGAFNH